VIAATGQLARRSIIRVLRQPQIMVSNLFFPLFFLVLNNAAIGRATSLGGFGTDEFLPFILAGTVVQAVMLSSTSAGTEVAIDIESGFFERLIASPVNRTAVLGGQMAGVAAFGAVLALFFAAIVAPFGATMRAGVVGYLVLAVVGALLAVGFGGLAVAMAIRTGSVEAVQGAFPLYFVVISVSSAFFPTDLMRSGYRAVAAANPVSWLVNALRELTLEPLDASAVGTSLGIATLFAAAGVAIARRSLSRRLARG
jgi:ABC-2 type transport system permease protein